MRAAVIYYKSYPENRGVAQLISLLVRLGHQVDLVAASIRHDRIKRNDPAVNYFSISGSRGGVAGALYKPLPFFNLWEGRLKRICRDRGWDFIFVRETLLANSCLAVGRRFSIPVFLDMRENRPEMLKSEAENKPARILLNLYLLPLESYEKRFLNRFDHIFTTTDQLKRWTIDTYLIRPDKISILGNYPSWGINVSAGGSRVDEADDPGFFKLVFSGSVDHTRGLQYVLPALRILIDKKINVSLHIIGRGDYLKELKDISGKLDLKRNVFFRDLVHPDILIETLSRFDVGLICDRVNGHTNVTVPGKLFEYMAAGLPVISSARKTVVQILEENRCGVVFNSFDAREIADCILRLKDPGFRYKLGLAGQEAVRLKYNEDVNLKNLKRVLQKHLSYGKNIT